MSRKRTKLKPFLDLHQIQIFFNQVWDQDAGQAEGGAWTLSSLLRRVGKRYVEYLRAKQYSIPRRFEAELLEELTQEIHRLWALRVYNPEKRESVGKKQKRKQRIVRAIRTFSRDPELAEARLKTEQEN